MGRPPSSERLAIISELESIRAQLQTIETLLRSLASISGQAANPSTASSGVTHDRIAAELQAVRRSLESTHQHTHNS